MKIYPIQEVTLTGNNYQVTRGSLVEMARLVKFGKQHPAIFALSRKIALPVDSKDFKGEAVAVYDWVKSNIKYRSDVGGLDTFISPEVLAEIKQGDCDDHAIMNATLLRALDHPARFKAVKIKGDKFFSHVYTETLIGQKWVPMDTTVDFPMGWEPPDIDQKIIGYLK